MVSIRLMLYPLRAMPSVECLIHRSEFVLLARAEPAGPLAAIGGPVRAGESPLAACVRQVREQTGLQVSPSCVAIVVEEISDNPTDYHLTFVAECPDPRWQPGDGLEWVPYGEIPRRPGISDLDRQLLPELLSSGAPVTVLIDIDASTQPPRRSLKGIMPIDPARLSPLVFAVR